MLPVHERMAELYTLNRGRPLTADEEVELQHCLQVNARYCWETARLSNESLLAALTEDNVWQQEIAAQLYELRLSGRTDKRNI